MTISNSDDIVDSRDIIARIAELLPFKVETHDGILLGEFPSRRDAAQFINDEEIMKAIIVEDEDDSEELQQLLDVQEQAGGTADWNYGETLIRSSYFTRTPAS